MRPTRSSSEIGERAIPFLEEQLDFLRSKSEPHRWWRTHRNPYGCWMCELIKLAEEAIYIAKSTQSNVVREHISGDNQELFGLFPVGEPMSHELDDK